MRNLYRSLSRRLLSLGLIGCVIGVTTSSTAAEPLPGTVRFNRDIRPILSDACFHCHGPDAAQRQADLRLDTEADALGERDGERVIVPGDAAVSELVRRITADDEFERMPPADSGRSLTPRQIELLKQWIDQGAKWEPHWAFIPPVSPSLPPSVSPSHNWPRNPIDQFILDRLVQEGLAPSPEAGRTTLIRRVTLDLTGLPPTPDDVDAFLADDSPDAYEKVVDRLLASPRYGERMAVPWLDAARYADTSGYQSDGERHMWRWRDWVIDAFNANMPFDQFTIEQLAGDMLPDATLEQKIATGFNRNHRGNAEGGIIPEEYAVEYVADRVETTAAVWLGLTVGCARCHDHKYDPVSQQEFYQLFAYFNNVPERGKAIKIGNSPPMIPAPTPDQQAELATLEQRLTKAEKTFRRLAPQIAAAQAEWEKSRDITRPLDWTVERGLLAHYPLDGDVSNQRGRTPPNPPLSRGGISSPPLDKGGPGGVNAAAQDARLPFAPGRLGQSVTFDGTASLDLGDVADFGFFDKFSCGAWILPDGKRDGTILSRMVDEPRGEGYAFILQDGRLHVHLVKRWLDDAIRVETEEPLPADGWQHVMMTYDGSRVADGVRIYVNGSPQKLTVRLDDLNQTFRTPQPLRIGAGGGSAGRFHGRIDDVRMYETCLSAEEVELVAVPESISEIAALPADERTSSQAKKLRAYFLEVAGPKAIRQTHRQVVALRRERDALIESFPTTMVMQEMQTPRETFVLLRGEYDKPGERVFPGVPAILPPLPRGVENNRLALARWLVDRSHPLTARVIVNRVWEQHFGIGLVKTSEDFGAQGDPPSHPDLLDWLAVEFMEGRGSSVEGQEPEVRDQRSEVSKQGSGDRRQDAGNSRQRADSLASSPPRSPPQQSHEPTGTTDNGQRTTDNNAWDLKALHRLIVTSATYRQSSRVTPELSQRDPENRLLAHGPRMRLSAEMLRDQALAAGGLLVERFGGPSVRPYQPAGLWTELTGGEDYVPDTGAALYRRSLYTFWKRTVAPPTMSVFDAAGRETCTVARSRTNTPLQALTLLNDVTFVEAARVLAERVLTEAGPTPDERLTRAFRLATARPPRPAELDILRAGLQHHLTDYRRGRQAALKLISIGESRPAEEIDPSELAAYTAMTGLILNLDETVTKE